LPLAWWLAPRDGGRGRARQEARKSGAAAPASVHPISGLKVVPLTISTKNGRHTFRVEVAVSEEEQAKGLMFRTQMGADEGMIFPMDPPRMAAFWMKNTVIPLDIVFIGPDHRVLNVAANAVPYDLTPLPSVDRAAAFWSSMVAARHRLGSRQATRSSGKAPFEIRRKRRIGRHGRSTRPPYDSTLWEVGWGRTIRNDSFGSGARMLMASRAH
jgi:uncharacterized membrane protein (UPF0127 family)